MKGYKTAYTPHEVKKKEEAAERRGIKMAVETIYAACVLAMIDNGIDHDTCQDCIKTANSVLESIVFDKTKLNEILDTLREDHGWEINFYGEK